VIHRYVQSAGVQLHYIDDGSGTAVVFLHGIPESSNAWTDYVELLAGARYHAAAPDLRGYGLSDKPRGVNSYRAELLVEDVATVIRSMGSGTASVVGQSWGGLAAWLFAMRHPEMLDRLVILNVPHPLHWAQALRTWDFWRRNWQMLFFQLPRVPEAALRARDYGALRRSLYRDLGGTRGVDDATIEAYISALRQPGSLRGALNYYRAFLRQNPFRLGWSLEVVHAPVLVMWGEHDRYFPVTLAHPPARWVTDARVEILPGARHWSHRDQPQRVQALLLDFLA
jgi:epoxide hydrolase 4